MPMNETRILVIDDEIFLQRMLSSYLSKFGYRVCMVSSGEEAIDMCESLTPDLILLDLMMPTMDGFETCEKLKEIPSLEYTPVLMLTGKKDTQSIHKSFEAGATDFITKPVNEMLLIKRVEYAIYNSRLQNTLTNKEQQLSEAQKIAKLGAIKINFKDRSVELSTKCFDELGLPNEENLFTFLEFMQLVHPDDKTHVMFTIDMAFQKKDHYMVEYRLRSNNGNETIIFQQGEFIEDFNEPEESYLLGSFQDVTDSRYAKDNLDYSKYYDALTELPNRFFFETQIKHILAHPPKDTLFSIVFLGLDHFSRVNDEYGHQGGDMILKELSDRLVKFESRGFIISRFGGDVFSILLKNLKHIDECSQILDEMLTEIRKPVTIDDNEIFITASIGASVFPLESEEEMQLLIGAEAAMMLSREDGGDRYTYRTNKMNLETQKRLSLIKEMRIALDRNDFVVYYQPQVDANTMNIVGMEALVRWLHPQRGLIPPDEFIPIAEESGMIIPLGDFVIEEACSQTKKWIDLGYELDVGVNISAQQFDADDFLDKIRAVLDKTELPKEHLEVEITESMAMKDHSLTVEKLSQLRELKVKTSMDDFGTGYSSLSQLQTLPLDTLKIDQAFVKCIKAESKQSNSHNHFENSAIANAIIAMSHSLGLRVIAEGVETIDQCKFLQQQNSEILQGYLFSKPVKAEELEQMLTNQKPLSSDQWNIFS